MLGSPRSVSPTITAASRSASPTRTTCRSPTQRSTRPSARGRCITCSSRPRSSGARAGHAARRPRRRDGAELEVPVDDARRRVERRPSATSSRSRRPRSRRGRAPPGSRTCASQRLLYTPPAPRSWERGWDAVDRAMARIPGLKRWSIMLLLTGGSPAEHANRLGLEDGLLHDPPPAPDVPHELTPDLPPEAGEQHVHRPSAGQSEGCDSSARETTRWRFSRRIARSSSCDRLSARGRPAKAARYPSRSTCKAPTRISPVDLGARPSMAPG